MIHINHFDELYSFCKALASPIRIQILSILSQEEQMSMNELSDQLGITSGALTPHIKYLENARIIEIQNVNGKHGVQKRCSLKEYQYLLSFVQENTTNMIETELPVGSYSRFEADAPCGISTPTSVIGQVDDPRYFDDPARIHADIIWLKQGFLEYRIPNYLKPHQKLVEIKLTQELNAVRAQTDEPDISDLHFAVNKVSLGHWSTSALQENQITQARERWRQFDFMPCGFLIELVITEKGSFLNGMNWSNITISDLGIAEQAPILYRISVSKETPYPNGLTLYGKNFGNYRQGITVSMRFEDK